jgi:GWxTD domain-containing protein
MRKYNGKIWMGSLAAVWMAAGIGVSGNNAFAQPPARTWTATAEWHSRDSRSYFDFGDPCYTSVVQSPDGSSADVRVTTASALLSYERTQKPSEIAKGAYYAIRDLTIEVNEQSESQPVITRDVIDTIYAQTYDQTVAKDQWHAISEELTLPKLDAKKHYSVQIEIRDGLLDRLAVHPTVSELRAPIFSNAADSNGIVIGDISLIDTLKGTNEEVINSPLRAVTLAHGNTYMFSRDVIGTASFEIAGAIKDNPTVEVRIRQVSNSIDPSDTGERAHFVLDAHDLYRDTVFAFQAVTGNGSKNDGKLRYSLIPSPVAPESHGVTGASAASAHTWTAIFTIPGTQLNQGKYAVSVHAKAGTFEQTRSNEFQLEWQNMPLSLEDPADAVPPLEYILPSDELKSINSGTRQEMIRKLYTYWKKQDPTPATAYNERMAAFYQRVDYADFNFANTRLLNGAMTDRGKVYLLYGPPTNVERTFIPGETPTETWTYANNVHQIFVFEDIGHADYRLTDVKNLAAK